MAIPDDLQQGVLSGNGTVKIEKSYAGAHSFIFLKINSGMHLMMNMIQRQNHFT